MLQPFAIMRSTGIQGFPTLIAGQGDDNQYELVTNGFQPGGRILPALEQWFCKDATTPSAEAGSACPSG